MKKIISSLLVLATIFTIGSICFTGSAEVINSPATELVEQDQNESLSKSDSICQNGEKAVVNGLDVISDDDACMANTAAGGMHPFEVFQYVCIGLFVVAALLIAPLHCAL